MPAERKKPPASRSARELVFDGDVYDLKAIQSAAAEFGPETGAVCTMDDGKVAVEFRGDTGLELEFRNLVLLRTIEEKKSR